MTRLVDLLLREPRTSREVTELRIILRTIPKNDPQVVYLGRFRPFAPEEDSSPYQIATRQMITILADHSVNLDSVLERMIYHQYPLSTIAHLLTTGVNPNFSLGADPPIVLALPRPSLALLLLHYRPDLDLIDEEGNNLLHFVSDLTLARALVEQGVYPHDQNAAGETILWGVADPNLLTYYLELGVDPNVSDRKGNYPLMEAPSLQIFRLLLAHQTEFAPWMLQALTQRQEWDRTTLLLQQAANAFSAADPEVLSYLRPGCLPSILTSGEERARIREARMDRKQKVPRYRYSRRPKWSLPHYERRGKGGKTLPVTEYEGVYYYEPDSLVGLNLGHCYLGVNAVTTLSAFRKELERLNLEYRDRFVVLNEVDARVGRFWSETQNRIGDQLLRYEGEEYIGGTEINYRYYLALRELGALLGYSTILLQAEPDEQMVTTQILDLRPNYLHLVDLTDLRFRQIAKERQYPEIYRPEYGFLELPLSPSSYSPPINPDRAYPNGITNLMILVARDDLTIVSSLLSISSLSLSLQSDSGHRAIDFAISPSMRQLLHFPKPPTEASRKPTEESPKELMREPVKELMREPVKEPMREPVKEPMREPVKELMREPMKEPVKEPMREPLIEPVKKRVAKVTGKKLISLKRG